MKRKKTNKPHTTKQSQISPPPVNPLITALELQQQGRLAEAESLFREILRIASTNEVALYSLSVILLNSGRHEEALHNTMVGTRANPDFAPLWLVHASALQALHRRDEAIVSYDQALVVNPKYIEALVNSGALLRDMHRHHDALERFRRVLDIDPDYETALGNYGILLTEFKQGALAVSTFERLLRKNPHYSYGLGLLSYERMHMCDWSDFEPNNRLITDRIREGQKACKTLGYMALSDSASDHFLCAKIFAKNQHPSRPDTLLWNGEQYHHARTRIAYVSPDLREHPVGHLMAGVFEGHDKSRFETIAISIGIDDGSRLRARMIATFDHFIDAKDMSPRQIAELMRQMEVDIAIDLAGYTSDAKTEMFLNRPAPIQINYLGYPGTMALECYDYILADRTVIPEAHQEHYSEKIAYLDHCYLPIASGIEVPVPQPRSAYGLPEQGFVFCAFSHDYKIHPDMFAVWMRLLSASPGSVLWLVSRNEVSQENLRQAAQRYGINPDRLIFATRVPKVEDHLARYRTADLFLDTWPYNAHTTAADALLAGLPVITYKGNAFPARVAASLLETLGFEQLVTASFDEYFELANALAHDPVRLQSLKKSLSPEELQGHPFLGASFTRSLERVLSTLAVSEVKDVADQGGINWSKIEDPLREVRLKYGISASFELSEQSVMPPCRHNRLFLIKAWGYGFWSEVHHVVGQLLLAELTQRTPIVQWGSNCLFRNENDVDAFGHFFQEISSAKLEDIPWTATIYPAKWSWSNIYDVDVNKLAGTGSRLTAPYLFDRPETLVVSDFFSTVGSIVPWIGKSSKYYGQSEDALYAEIFQKYFKPVANITSKVSDFCSRNMQGRPWLAVHVRGSDKVLETPLLAKINDDYFGFVDRIIELNPTIGVFLLTDSVQVVEEYKARYGARVLCTQATRTSSSDGVHLSGLNGVTIGEEVLVDSLLALKCNYFIGNIESNVSLAISSMRTWPQGFIFLLGEESARSEVPAKTDKLQTA